VVHTTDPAVIRNLPGGGGGGFGQAVDPEVVLVASGVTVFMMKWLLA